MSSKEQFTEKVAALVAKGVDRASAVQTVAKKFPDLHRAIVAEANPRQAAVLAEHEAFQPRR